MERAKARNGVEQPSARRVEGPERRDSAEERTLVVVNDGRVHEPPYLSGFTKGVKAAKPNELADFTFDHAQSIHRFPPRVRLPPGPYPEAAFSLADSAGVREGSGPLWITWMALRLRGSGVPGLSRRWRPLCIRAC